MIDWKPIEKLAYREDRFLLYGMGYGCCLAEFHNEAITFFYDYRWFNFDKKDGFTHFAELTPPKVK